MADAIVSALVSTIMGILNSSILQELELAGGLKTELENLKRKFRTIQAVLQDAEVKQWKDEPVKVWLRRLQDAAYGVDDVLDDDEYKQFEKLIQEDLREVDNRMEEEEVDAAENIEEAESLEQKAYRERVELLKKKKMELMAARASERSKGSEVASKESSQEDSSSDDDSDVNFAVDWRAQHL